MEPWSAAQRAFAVKAFYKNGDSFMIARREFRREFGIHRNRTVPSAHAIKTWVRNFEATGSTLKKRGGSVKTVYTTDNIAVLREATERILTVLRVATLSLGLSEASVRRILHKDLHFYPCKFHVTNI
jgi:transposase